VVWSWPIERHPDKQIRSRGTLTMEDKVSKGELTKANILQAARERFAADGYERSTIRVIAADVGVDPALVMRYFGNKEKLFAAAADFDLRIPSFEGVPQGKLGRALAEHILNRWEGDDNLKALLRAAATNPDAQARIQQIFGKQLVPAISRLCADPSTAVMRVGLIASQAMGLALTRYVFRLPPVTAMSREQIIDWIGPTLQRYLVGKL
jgi:AcrR family transcriptional regulator